MEIKSKAIQLYRRTIQQADSAIERKDYEKAQFYLNCLDSWLMDIEAIALYEEVQQKSL